MNDTYIVTAFSVIDDLLRAYGQKDDVRTTVSGAEILIVIVAQIFSESPRTSVVYSDAVGGHPADQCVAFQSTSTCPQRLAVWDCESAR